MKKISIVMAAAVAALMSACNGSTPSAKLENEVDTLTYAIGMAQTEGLKPYLTQRLNVDTTYMDEFVKGLSEGASAGEDKKKAAYYAGIQIGQQIGQQMVKGLNYEIFGEDSTQTISINNFVAGFVAALQEKNPKMTMNEAKHYAETKLADIKKKNMESKFGENKKAGEAYMAKIAKKEGVKSLGKGIFYEVVTEGKGEIPSDTSMVKVNYEGKLIDGVIFDSSYKRNTPTSFRANQVIPGWTEALVHMPVGSKWIVYIPQEQGYAEREAGSIKPFSALVFTIELLSIEK